MINSRDKIVRSPEKLPLALTWHASAGVLTMPVYSSAPIHHVQTHLGYRGQLKNFFSKWGAVTFTTDYELVCSVRRQISFFHVFFFPVTVHSQGWPPCRWSFGQHRFLSSQKLAGATGKTHFTGALTLAWHVLALVLNRSRRGERGLSSPCGHSAERAMALLGIDNSIRRLFWDGFWNWIGSLWDYKEINWRFPVLLRRFSQWTLHCLSRDICLINAACGWLLLYLDDLQGLL